MASHYDKTTWTVFTLRPHCRYGRHRKIQYALRNVATQQHTLPHRMPRFQKVINLFLQLQYLNWSNFVTSEHTYVNLLFFFDFWKLVVRRVQHVSVRTAMNWLYLCTAPSGSFGGTSVNFGKAATFDVMTFYNDTFHLLTTLQTNLPSFRWTPISMGWYSNHLQTSGSTQTLISCKLKITRDGCACESGFKGYCIVAMKRGRSSEKLIFLVILANIDTNQLTYWQVFCLL